MSIKETIYKDLTDSMKSKDQVQKNFLKVLKGEIQNKELTGIPSTDENVLIILRKMEKSLTQINNTESEMELAILRKYIPSMPDAKWLKEKIIECKSSIDLEKNIPSQVMKSLNAKYPGKIDNKMAMVLISEIF